MAAQTPRQTVDAKFGGRTKLVDDIVSLTGGDKETRQRLMGTTNKKLLRIHEVATTVKSRFGGKAGLIDAMEALQFAHTKSKKANAGWREKMEGFTVKRLLDMHRQLTTRKAPNS